MDWEAILSGAVSGGLFGALATLYAPRVQRAMERQRERDQHRRQLIREWRVIVQNPKGDARQSPAILDLIRHIPEEDKRVVVLMDKPGEDTEPARQYLISVVEELERKWFAKD